LDTPKRIKYSAKVQASFLARSGSIFCSLKAPAISGSKIALISHRHEQFNLRAANIDDKNFSLHARPPLIAVGVSDDGRSTS